MDLSPIAELITANPAGVAAALGTIVAFVFQGLKKLSRVPSGEGKLGKVAAAGILSTTLTALLLAWAAQYLSGSIDAAQLISVALGAWLASAGVHSTVLKGRGGK